MIDLFGKLILLIAALLCVRIYQIYRSPILLLDTNESDSIEFRSSRLRDVFLTKKHVLLSASWGSDLQKVVQQAVDAPSSTSKVFVPINIDLNSIDSDDFNLLSVSKKFMGAARQFDADILRRLRKYPVDFLVVLLNQHWKQIFTLTNTENPTDFSTIDKIDSEASISSMLQAVIDKAEETNRLLITAQGEKAKEIVSVIVLDEFQLLEKLESPSARREFLKVWIKYARMKEDSKAVFVLTSSAPNPRKLIIDWGGKEKQLDAVVFHDHVGDLLHDQAREFLEALAAAARRAPSPASPQALQRLSDRLAKDTEFDRIYKRYGGFTPDLVRLALAQADQPLEDVQISDNSRVQLFSVRMDTEIQEAGLEAKHVASVFSAVLQSALGPRGAVSVAELVDNRGVPEATLDKMATLGLIEVHDHLPDAVEFVELRALMGEAYVIAPCPLARESMARVLRRLADKKRGVLPNNGAGTGGAAGAKAAPKAGPGSGTAPGSGATAAGGASRKEAPRKRGPGLKEL